MTTAQTTRTPQWRTLDTFDATLHNCLRTESVTEIQDADTGDLICYANPEHASMLCALLADRDRLRAALEDMVYLADDLTDGQLAADCESERNFNAAHERARKVLEQSDKT